VITPSPPPWRARDPAGGGSANDARLTEILGEDWRAVTRQVRRPPAAAPQRTRVLAPPGRTTMMASRAHGVTPHHAP
jgi:hypothetical protein